MLLAVRWILFLNITQSHSSKSCHAQAVLLMHERVIFNASLTKAHRLIPRYRSHKCREREQVEQVGRYGLIHLAPALSTSSLTWRPDAMDQSSGRRRSVCLRSYWRHATYVRFILGFQDRPFVIFLLESMNHFTYWIKLCSLD